jgi:hypothetical protein
MEVIEEHEVLQKAELSGTLIHAHGSILAARYADTSLATTTGHIMC